MHDQAEKCGDRQSVASDTDPLTPMTVLEAVLRMYLGPCFPCMFLSSDPLVHTLPRFQVPLGGGQQGGDGWVVGIDDSHSTLGVVGVSQRNQKVGRETLLLLTINVLFLPHHAAKPVPPV